MDLQALKCFNGFRVSCFCAVKNLDPILSLDTQDRGKATHAPAIRGPDLTSLKTAGEINCQENLELGELLDVILIQHTILPTAQVLTCLFGVDLFVGGAIVVNDISEVL